MCYGREFFQILLHLFFIEVQPTKHHGASTSKASKLSQKIKKVLLPASKKSREALWTLLWDSWAELSWSDRAGTGAGCRDDSSSCTDIANTHIHTFLEWIKRVYDFKLKTWNISQEWRDGLCQDPFKRKW